mmetsp:Transcript_36377/g.95904  ORF Transcript_36377/g.95904 Transcript_36377/m.95904 type:complete len:204 (+) Transcript_36377:2142-2753(+)
MHRVHFAPGRRVEFGAQLSIGLGQIDQIANGRQLLASTSTAAAADGTANPSRSGVPPSCRTGIGPNAARTGAAYTSIPNATSNERRARGGAACPTASAAGARRDSRRRRGGSSSWRPQADERLELLPATQLGDLAHEEAPLELARLRRGCRRDRDRRTGAWREPCACCGRQAQAQRGARCVGSAQHPPCTGHVPCRSFSNEIH